MARPVSQRMDTTIDACYAVTLRLLHTDHITYTPYKMLPLKRDVRIRLQFGVPLHVCTCCVEYFLKPSCTAPTVNYYINDLFNFMNINFSSLWLMVCIWYTTDQAIECMLTK